MDTPEHSDTLEYTDVAIIGGGPSGAAAAAWLARHGLAVRVLERQHFPRFSIGESLLPQCMAHLETCGLLEAAQAGHFQPKNGAAFCWKGQYAAIDFREKLTPGPGTTWQIERADFDQRLLDGARDAGADVEHGVSVIGFTPDPHRPQLTMRDDAGKTRQLEARFVLDASGYGRVLARLTGLDCPSSLATRGALFTHVEGLFGDADHDRNKILIGVHPEQKDIWYWLIPFPDGRASVGVVADIDTLDAAGDNDTARYWALINAEPRFNELLTGVTPVRDVTRLAGYSANIKRLHGPGFAVLGNAGEFLDPVFSSGITIALDSAVRAAPLVTRQLDGEDVDWDGDFEIPLREGIATFRAFIDAWYDGRLPRIIFHEHQTPRIRDMLSAILAGYAWDKNNPFVTASQRRLDSLAEACTQEAAVSP
ncbi:NAD(P)/FAD-dependent oxidoreductase [Vreelandella subglaciescola]|uniref:Dehydrogenase (Flavoprotein) n=1 Tax=Vreelandella subglaciescola TaxID=29571 RepID=A0A1M7I763_9GAMM|nr:NAD(P)/FAD-dependent oxidoreductase [Halomonas subglaciescola]SHM36584.1 Dehydrogenase (flavoprotein) [Halomonas subglaciescola]